MKVPQSMMMGCNNAGTVAMVQCRRSTEYGATGRKPVSLPGWRRPGRANSQCRRRGPGLCQIRGTTKWGLYSVRRETFHEYKMYQCS